MAEGNWAAGGLPTAASVPSLAAGPTAGGGADDGHGHAFAPTVARTSDTGAAPKPLYRRPWVWIGGAVVVAAAVAAGVVVVRDERRLVAGDRRRSVAVDRTGRAIPGGSAAIRADAVGRAVG